MNSVTPPMERLVKIQDVIKQYKLALPLPANDSIALINALGIFDASYYFAENKDLEPAGIDPVVHYMTVGWQEGRNPASWFDTEYYSRTNCDTGFAGNPFLHYIFHGFGEGRQPNPYQEASGSRLVLSLSPHISDYDAIAAGLQSLLNQTKKADKIIVQLPKAKFENKDFCLNFIEYLDQGIDLHWCEDLGPYSKLIPALSEYQKDVIVTCNPAWQYAPDFLQTLYSAWQAEPEAAQCIKSSALIMNEDGATFRFGDQQGEAALLLVPHADFGLLLPPNAWKPEIMKKKYYLRAAPTFDDLWYGLATALSGLKIYRPREADRMVAEASLKQLLYEDKVRTKADTFFQEAANIMELYRELGAPSL